MILVRRTKVHLLFEIGVWTRGVQGVFQLIAALCIYFTSTTTIANILLSVGGREMSEDPHDLVARILLHSAEHISRHGKDFAALFFFVSAVINIMLVIGLHLNRRSLYPVAVYIIALFTLYQMWLYVHSLSPWLIALAIYDGAVIWLIYLEYRIPPHRSEL